MEESKMILSGFKRLLKAYDLDKGLNRGADESSSSKGGDGGHVDNTMPLVVRPRPVADIDDNVSEIVGFSRTRSSGPGTLADPPAGQSPKGADGDAANAASADDPGDAPAPQDKPLSMDDNALYGKDCFFFKRRCSTIQ